MLRAYSRRIGDQEAATAVEYAIMIVLIAVVIIVAVVFVGRETQSNFECTSSSIADPDSAGSMAACN